MNRSGYRAEIDGMRAIAVLMVLLFHAGFGFSGGYIGVDVFFVISGYLITGLIAKDLQADRFRFIDFWERRIRRIFPALATMVLTTLLLGVWMLLPQDFVQLAESAGAQTLLAANFYFLDRTNYFDGSAELKPLLHTWSLAVEEQFYLCLPALLILWRRAESGIVRQRLILLAALSFGLSVWGSYAFAKATFYLLPMRMWELLIGSILALAPSQWAVPPRWRNPLSLLGLAAILIPGVWYTSTTRFPGANAALPCLGTALLIFSNTAGLSGIGRLLSLRPAVFVGRISYSLYLWHWPVLALLRHRFGESLNLELRCSAVAASFVLAWISWKWVETPLRHARSVSTRKVYGFSTATSLLILGVSAVVIQKDGLRFRFPPRVLQILDSARIANLPREDIVSVGPQLKTGETGAFLLWGDSHARAISELVRDLADRHGIPGYIASRSATVPVLGTWRPNDPEAERWNSRILEFIKDHHIQHVLIASRWTINIDGRPDGSMNSLIVDAETEQVSPETAGTVLVNGLQRTLEQLQAAGVTTWIIQQVPQQQIDVSRRIAQQALFHQPLEVSGVSLAEHRTYQARVNSILEQFAGQQVHLLDPARYCFDESGRARVHDAESSFYFDNNHLSPDGAKQLLEPLLAPLFAGIAQQQEPARLPSHHQPPHQSAAVPVPIPTR